MTPLYYPPTRNALQKSLDVQLDMGVTASATLNNTTGVQNKPGVVVISRIDTNGNLNPTSDWEWISYNGTSGSTITTLTRGLGGSSDQDHAVGSIVEFVPDIVWAQAVIDALATVVSTSDVSAVNTTNIVTPTGSQTLTNKTLTSPTINTPSLTSPSVTSGDLNIATGGNVQVNSTDPRRAIYIPASAMFGATTSGAATGQTETTTNKINYKSLDFDASTREYGWFVIPAPSYWDLGTVIAEFHWTAASGSGDVIWAIQGLAASNDDATDAALGTAVTVTDTLLSAGDEHLTSDTTACTIAGTPAKDDFLFFRVYRDAAAGGDTLGVDAKLTGVTIRFKIAQYDDQ